MTPLQEEQLRQIHNTLRTLALKMEAARIEVKKLTDAKNHSAVCFAAGQVYNDMKRTEEALKDLIIEPIYDLWSKTEIHDEIKK